MKKPYIVILTGPTCAGKTTLEKLLVEAGMLNMISTTTRERREGEVDGINYYFVSKSRFQSLLENNSLVEHVEFDGNSYGLSRAEVLRSARMGRPLVVVAEPNGRDQILKYCRDNGWGCHTIYVGNPSVVIAERFLKRLRTDLNKCVTDAEVTAVTQRYAGRLQQMLTTEREWVREAEESSQKHVYSRILWNFNEYNQAAVKQSIASFATTEFERLNQEETQAA